MGLSGLMSYIRVLAGPAGPAAPRMGGQLVNDKERHDRFELRRQSDDLVYSFRKMQNENGEVGYKRSDGDHWIMNHAEYGWVAWDFQSRSVMGRPWEVLPGLQGDHPPEGVWVSRKASKSYVYLLVYV